MLRTDPSHGNRDPDLKEYFVGGAGFQDEV